MCPVCGKSVPKNRIFCSYACLGKSKRKPPVFNTCEICGAEFKTNRFDLERGFGRFCSRRCANVGKSRKSIRTCQHCGKEFVVYPSNDQRYCSYECSAHSRMNSQTCPTCGKTFWAKPSWHKKYCSLRCRGIAQRDYVERICENCGKSYIAAKAKRKRFCSAKCAKKFSMDSELINTTYQSFTPSLKERIRQRDNYTCQLCGKTQQKRAMSVHHINYDKGDVRPENLITLCDTCHPKTHYNRAYWTEYFMSHN